MNYTHDAFGHITQFSGAYYNMPQTSNYSYDNTNRSPYWSYDAEGNVNVDDEASYTVDAAGRLIKTSQFDPDSGLPMAPTRDWFDGNGRLAKRVKNFGSSDPAPQANYYLRSSVTGAVLSETEQTGRKLKTFVPANGTTLAEQEMVTIGSTTTEKLTFIHQDPSLASLQRTDNAGNLVNSNARAGEYDALGRNVADAGPYVTLNTDPPVGDSGGSGINLDGSAQGYRPGRGNYLVDGLPVPEDYARDLINSGRMGGIFGVVEAAVRISNRDGQWIDSDGPCTVSPGNDFCVGTATRYFQLNSSWGASGLINDVTDDELDAALRALAGPGWGPNGGSEFLDDLVSPFIQSWNKESECATRLSQLFGNGTSVVATVLNPPNSRRLVG
ncbi:MAG: hypothetical protein IPK58_08515 [Acidobacteria bacterium]|nr:hypothetical protein [Acidobacteriota bacterium]